MNELTTQTNQIQKLEVVEDYKQIAIDYIKSTGSKLNENQITQFINACVAYKLSPVKREIYAVPYGDKFNLIVGYEVYLKRAERSGLLQGWRVWTEGEGNNLIAKLEIDRKDWRSKFYHEVYMSEYSQNTPLWKSKPKTMIKKVAIAQGFRLCFPEDLGGIPYTRDELPDIPEVEENIINITPQADTDEAPEVEELKKLLEEYYLVLDRANAIGRIKAPLEAHDLPGIKQILQYTKDWLKTNNYMI